MQRSKLITPTLWAVWMSAAPQLAPLDAARQVEISVVVRDPMGTLVPGLKQGDFKIFDQGQPQDIRQFLEQTQKIPALVTTPQLYGYFSNEAGQHPGTPTSVTVVLLDDLNGADALAPPQVMSSLRALGPDAQIAVYQLSTDLRILQGYTAESWETNLLNGCEWCGWRYIPSDGMDRRLSEFASDETVRATFRAIEYIANNLAAMPGRKNLVWVSSAFPQDMSRNGLIWTGNVLDALNGVNVAIYPVAAAKLANANAGKVLANLAQWTGGRAFMDPASIPAAIHSAFQDSCATYTLSFILENEAFDNSFHTLQVTLPSSPSARLNYRTGYADLKSDDKNLEARLLDDFVWSPLEATGIGLRAEVQGTSTGLNVSLRVDARPSPLHVRFAQIDARGKLLAREDATVGDAEKAASAKVEQEGIIYRRDVTRSLKAKALRVIVRDADTGSIGSITVPLG